MFITGTILKYNLTGNHKGQENTNHLVSTHLSKKEDVYYLKVDTKQTTNTQLIRIMSSFNNSLINYVVFISQIVKKIKCDSPT